METVKRSSTKKQILLILLCSLVYCVAYVGRKSFNVNIVNVIKDYGVGEDAVGLPASFFFFAYGIGQIVNAFLCKYYPKRFIIAGALLASSGINCVMYFLPATFEAFEAIKFLWLANGVFQSVLWSTLILTLSENIEKRLLKYGILAMSISFPLGTILVYGGAAVFSLPAINFYRGTYLYAIAVMVVMAIFWFTSYNYLTADKPLLEPEEPVEEEKKKSTVGGIPAVLIGLVVVCSFFAIADNLIKDGTEYWAPRIFETTFGLRISESLAFTLVLPICGFFGSAFALFVNKFIKDFRSLTGCFYFITSLCLGAFFLILKSGDSSTLMLIISVALLGIIALLGHGINDILLSIMPLTLREKVNAGLLTGILNGFCYVGSTLSTYVLAIIGKNYGWNAAILTLFWVSIGVTVLAGVTTLIHFFKSKSKEKIK